VAWRGVACGRGYGLDVGAFMDVGASRGRGQRSWTWTSMCHGRERERAPSWTSVDAITEVVVDIDQTAAATERGRDHRRRREPAPESGRASGRVCCRRADPKLTRENPMNGGPSRLSERREISRYCNDATAPDASKLIKREKINLRWDRRGAASASDGPLASERTMPLLTERVSLFGNGCHFPGNRGGAGSWECDILLGK
jgi:hypothetical protein